MIYAERFSFPIAAADADDLNYNSRLTCTAESLFAVQDNTTIVSFELAWVCISWEPRRKSGCNKTATPGAALLLPGHSRTWWYLGGY